MTAHARTVLLWAAMLGPVTPFLRTAMPRHITHIHRQVVSAAHGACKGALKYDEWMKCAEEHSTRIASLSGNTTAVNHTHPICEYVCERGRDKVCRYLW